MKKLKWFLLGTLSGVILTIVAIAATIAILFSVPYSSAEKTKTTSASQDKVVLISTSANTEQLTNIINNNKAILGKEFENADVTFSADGEILKMSAKFPLFGKDHNFTAEVVPKLLKDGLVEVEIKKLQIERLPLTAPGILEMVNKKFLGSHEGVKYDEKTKAFTIDTKIFEKNGFSFEPKKIDIKHDLIELDILQRKSDAK
ncbi:MAG: DUF2140 family protein [Lactobacillales bacterium]|jgi:uncharacterized protein YpmS|nr:DUF2140 family protein [Lactobacillales bacterium]